MDTPTPSLNDQNASTLETIFSSDQIRASFEKMLAYTDQLTVAIPQTDLPLLSSLLKEHPADPFLQKILRAELASRLKPHTTSHAELFRELAVMHHAGIPADILLTLVQDTDLPIILKKFATESSAAPHGNSTTPAATDATREPEPAVHDTEPTDTELDTLLDELNTELLHSLQETQKIVDNLQNMVNTLEPAHPALEGAAAKDSAPPADTIKPTLDTALDDLANLDLDLDFNFGDTPDNAAEKKRRKYRFRRG